MKKNVDFSILSSIYDFLGSIVFFGALHRSQVYFIDQLKKPDRALIIGGGTGRFLVDLLKSEKVKNITYVDISQGMIARAKKKVSALGKENQVEFICGGVDAVPDRQYDLICTHYFLDCFEEEKLCLILSKLRGLLSKEGEWYFTDFYLDESSSFIKTKFVGFLYFFFRILCGLKVKILPDFKKVFTDLELNCESEKYFFRGLLRTAIYKNQSLN